VVFIDKDGNGKFDAEKDEPVEGARIICGKTEATTGKDGMYILRNLPAGTLEARAKTSWGAESEVVRIILGAEPVRRKGLNFAVRP
jgi:hypothetical protein